MAFVRMESVSIDFPIYDIRGRSLRNMMIRKGTKGRVGTDDDGCIRVKALRDISLELRDGDRVGLIGPNGAGKSTLLRTLAGIYEPPEGSITISGRVATLLDLSLGIAAELTGRENVYLRGLILGMSKDEISGKIDDIEEFVELGQSFDLPVRTYSSGMLVRLAFAISTSIEPEILLVDEIMGAGDQHFMKKASERLDKIMGQSKILVMASHMMDYVEQSCNKGMLIRDGRIDEMGPMAEIVEKYVQTA